MFFKLLELLQLKSTSSDKRLEKVNKGAKVKPSLKKLPSKKK
jgi:hypothetical protein